MVRHTALLSSPQQLHTHVRGATFRDVFFLGDTLLQVLYYATALVGQCCIDSDGDTRKPGQLLQKFRMACCLPLSFCWYLVGIIFGGVNWVCFEYEANPPRLWFFQYTFLGCT